MRGRSAEDGTSVGGSGQVPVVKIGRGSLVHGLAGLSLWERMAAVLVIVWAGVLVYRAMTMVPALDTGLAYSGGLAAWATGHPERLLTWISSPFLAMLMALITRIMSSGQAATAVTALNSLLSVITIAAVWSWLRPRVSRVFWWLSLGLGAAYAPLASTIFWRQFNLVSLVLVTSGFLLAMRRPSTSGFLVALSLAIKPVGILVPLAMLWKRDLRRAGAWSLGWGLLMLGISQGFLAWRSGSLSTLNPFPALANFEHKSLPNTTGWVCAPENFSPQSTICRIVGDGSWNLERDAVLVGAVALIAICAVSLWRTRGTNVEVLAFACALSPMLSPIAWSHYQLFLAPLFLLLAYRLHRQGATVAEWTLLAAALFLAELTWRPYGMLNNILPNLLRGTPAYALYPHTIILLGYAEGAQYVLIVAALMWANRNAYGLRIRGFTTPDVSSADVRAERGRSALR